MRKVYRNLKIENINDMLDLHHKMDLDRAYMHNRYIILDYNTYIKISDYFAANDMILKDKIYGIRYRVNKRISKPITWAYTPRNIVEEREEKINNLLK